MMPFLVLLILALQPPSLLMGEEMAPLQKEGVTVLFEESLRAGAQETARLYPLTAKYLRQKLGWEIPFRPTVHLMGDNKAFQRMAGSELVVAFAVPEKDLIVIDYPRVIREPFTLEGTLRHELCHLLLHHHVKKERLPRWLDEGVAQWVSEGITEIIMNQKNPLLNEAVLMNRLIPLRRLTDHFPADRDSLILAYEESRSLISYLVAAYGADRLLMLLGYLKEGAPVETALMRSISSSPDELEGEWHRSLRTNLTWITYAIHHLYNILFFLAALITIAGFIRIMIKKKAYRDEEEESEPQNIE